MSTILRIADGRTVRLGRHPSMKLHLENNKRIMLRDFVKLPKMATPLLPITTSIDWWAVANQDAPTNDLKSVLGNSTYGNCAWAAPEHLQQLASATHNIARPDNTTELVKQYFAYTGGRDTGSNMGDVLRIWQQTGICGNKIRAFASIAPSDHEMIEYAIQYMSGVYFGVNLPAGYEQQQTHWQKNAGRIIGGHAIFASTFTPDGLSPGTWGVKVGMMDWAAFDQYCDECYAVDMSLWADANLKSPAGLDAAALDAQMAEITTIEANAA